MTTLLPEHLSDAAPAPVTDAGRRLNQALERLDEAGNALNTAKVALDLVEQEDAEAARRAVTGDKSPPASLRLKREGELEAAQRREKAAYDLAREAADEYSRAVNGHCRELIDAQMPRVGDAADEAIQELEQVAEKVQALALEAGILHSLHNPSTGVSEQSRLRLRSMGRRLPIESPSFDPLATNAIEHVEVIRAEIERLSGDATPLSERILAIIGDKPTKWDDVAAALGVNPVDGEACAMRAFLLDKGDLAWCDRDGDSLPPTNPRFGVVVRDRYLRRQARPLTSVGQARAERRAREATAA